MDTQDRGSSVAFRPVPEALDQFAQETDTARTDAAAFVIECEPRPPATISTPGSLLDVTPARPANRRERPLSRLESSASRRHKRRMAHVRRVTVHAAAWGDRIASAWTTFATGVAWGSGVLTRAAARLTHRARPSRTTASRHAMRCLSVTRDHLVTTRDRMRWLRDVQVATPGNAVEYQEANGSLVAVLLALTVVSYGSFLMGSWRGASPEAAMPAIVTRDAATVTPAPAVLPATVTAGATVSHAPEPTPAATRTVAPTAVRRAVLTPTARTITAMWQRRDTRSLVQAFDALRRQTLAFHRCGMRVTQPDRAVARCEGVGIAADAPRAATWTIDFRRTAGRWIIAGVTAR